jgi:probable phosphoglycerate mutase
MERMRRALGLEPGAYRQDARWKELSFGAWEGLTWRELRARDPTGARARERDKWAFVPPGGESYAALAERVAPALGELRGEVVLVAHGGVARVLLALAAGVNRAEAPRLDIWQGRVLVISGGAFRWV